MIEPATRKDLNGIALDLGGTKLAAARVEAGSVVDHKTAPTKASASAAEQVAEMLRLAGLVGLGITSSVGLAVTGRVDSDGTWRAVNTDTLSNLADMNLRKLASSAFGRSVSVINDAQAAAIAEYHFGAGAGSEAMAYVTVSTGVGGGFVIGGRLVSSPNGLAGHVGFSTCRGSKEICGCGRHGTVESISSGHAIAGEAHRRGHTVASAKDVFDQWHAGADWAAEIVETSAAAVAELCANLAAMLGIERVVLGGSIGLARGYSASVSKHLATEPNLFHPELMTAGLGQDGVLIGALLHRQISASEAEGSTLGTSGNQ